MNFEKINKVLIIRLSSLGDVLLTTPLLRTLKQKYPHLQIDFLLREQYKDVLINNPYKNNLIIYSSEKDETDLLSELKEKEYDLIIDLQNNLRSLKIRSILKGIRRRFNKKTLDKFLLVKFKINRLKNSPVIPERYASSLDNFELDDKGLDFFTTNVSSDLFKENHNYIGFCPGSRHFSKMWPKEYFVRLGNKLKKESYRVALFGGKEDKSICEEIGSQISDSLNLCNEDDILQTAADMKKCAAVVCNDSGLMHTACAVKIPVLSFFGSTVKEFGFTPYGNTNIILENNSLSCRPCSHIGKSYCPKDHFKCMLELTPDMALEKLKLLLHS